MRRFRRNRPIISGSARRFILTANGLEVGNRVRFFIRTPYIDVISVDGEDAFQSGSDIIRRTT